MITECRWSSRVRSGISELNRH